MATHFATTMPTPSNSDTSLASDADPYFKPRKSLPRRREIVIRIYAGEHGTVMDGAGAVRATPTLPLTPPEPTDDGESSSGSERGGENNGSYRVDSDCPAIRITTPSMNFRPTTPDKTPPRSLATNQPRQEPPCSRAEPSQTAYASDTNPAIPPPQVRLPRHGRRAQRRSERKGNNGQGAKPSRSGATGVIGSPDKQTERTSRNESSSNSPESGQSGYPPESSEPQKTDIDMRVPKIRRTNERCLRDRVNDPLEQFRKDIGWPFSSVARSESQRISGISTTSTVEARIVDGTPQPKKRALRHTEKRSSLRSFSSPVTNSERASSTDSQRRLVHKAARITEQDRKSIAPEISFANSMSEVPQRTVDVVPVVVIPERRSSRMSSAPTSTQRRATAPRRTSSLGPARQERRMSESTSAFSDDLDSRGRSVRRPVVPPRRSSLSAPTSTHNSRATSLTSDSLRNPTLALGKHEATEGQAEQSVHERPRDTLRSDSHDADDVKTQSILVGVENMAELSPSLPFNLDSPSSPFEVNEARTVAFYPHHNESLLLVDQQHREAQNEQARLNSQNNPDELDTLPSQPPQPPSCRIIPPTPMEELDQESNNTNDQQPIIRRLNSLRRAWSRRRPRPESINALKRSFSTTSATNPTAGKDLDSRLHPFWRPRRFWDDSPQSSPPAFSPTYIPNRTNTTATSTNAQGTPQPAFPSDGPTTNCRISPKTTPYDPALNHSSLIIGNTTHIFSPTSLSSTTGRPRSALFRPLSWWGYTGVRARAHLSSLRLHNLRRRARRRLEVRKEVKNEVRRERIRRKIRGR